MPRLQWLKPLSANPPRLPVLHCDGVPIQSRVATMKMSRLSKYKKVLTFVVAAMALTRLIAWLAKF